MRIRGRGKLGGLLFSVRSYISERESPGLKKSISHNGKGAYVGYCRKKGEG